MLHSTDLVNLEKRHCFITHFDKMSRYMKLAVIQL